MPSRASPTAAAHRDAIPLPWRATRRLLVLTLLAGCVGGPDDSDDTGLVDTSDTADTGGGDTSDTTEPDVPFPSRYVRVVVWNMASIGTPGSEAYEAAKRVLGRIDADVVAINEIGSIGDIDNLDSFADELGYASVVVPPSNPFGTVRNAIISKAEPTESSWPDPAELSGDLAANDVTRYPVVVTHDLVDAGPLTVVTQHWKSGTASADAFRRAVESHRTVQAARRGDPQSAWVVIGGDVNNDIFDEPSELLYFTRLPSTLPSQYFLGQDLHDIVFGPGLRNDVFLPMEEEGYQLLDVTQRDGSYATRPESGRRIDYLFLGPAVDARWRGEVYSCNDLLPGLPMAGDPITPANCAIASDHLPLVLDLALP